MLVLLAGGALAAYWYFYQRQQPSAVALPNVNSAAEPNVVVDGSGQVLSTPVPATPAPTVPPIFDPNSQVYFAASDPRIAADSPIAPVGYVFGGIYRVKSLGSGGLTCLVHSGTCGDASSIFAPKGTVVENLRDGSTYTVN